MRKALIAAVVFLASTAFGQATLAAPTSCEHLAQLVVTSTKITSAYPVAAGAFIPPSTPPLSPDQLKFYKDLPAFCRVVAQSRPSPDSDIRIEVWLPLTDWNGRFQAPGNGGFAGSMPYRALGAAIKHGYATAGTDTGHSTEGAEWALGHREKVVDFGYRAVHQMTQFGKAAAKAFYGSDPRYSYFVACSDGGREALMEAQRYPEDYNGILAGAPANYWTHLMAFALWGLQAMPDQASQFSTKLPAIAAAVLAACDKQDGVADGVLSDPRQCHFDPATLACKASTDRADCLTPPQVAALKKLYAGPHDAQGRSVFPGILPGAELGNGGWSRWVLDSEKDKSLAYFFAVGFFSNMVYEKPQWDFHGVSFEDAVKLADEKTGAMLNAIDPDLKAFHSHGGKLVLYHGWNDPAIPAMNTVDYFNRVASAMGEQTTQSFVRLYMVPGMQHCNGGPGATSFGQAGARSGGDPQHDVFLALEQWVEKGVAPAVIITSKYEKDATRPVMTRPLCPYPQVAKYKGAGDTNDAASFTCATGR